MYVPRPTAERTARACDRSVLVVTAPPSADYLRPLVAADLSPLTRQSIEIAHQLAPVASMNVLVVHTLPSSFGWNKVPVPSEVLRGWEAEEEQRAHRQLDRWIAENGAAPVKLCPRVSGGEIAPTILAEAARERADLLVVGSRGRSTVVHLALGAVAEKVVRRATCDVLIVRQAK
jgi:nucleotide-binding universal stress UspA family protein